MRLMTTLLMLLVVAPADAQSMFPRSPLPRSLNGAREVLVAAAEAHGGLEKLRAIKTAYRGGRGKTYTLGQGMLPDAPPIMRDLESELWMDFAGNRVRNETKSRIGGVPTNNRAVMSGDTGYFWNAATGTSTRAASAAQLTGLRNALRRDPLRLIVNALSRLESARSIGTEQFQGRAHDVLVIADTDGSLLTFYFDSQSHLLSKLETWSDAQVLGDTLTEQIFSDYRTVNGIKVPFRLTVRTAGQTVQETAYSTIRLDEPPPAEAFDIPKDVLDPSPIATAPMHVTTLAPGVHLLGGGAHNTLSVEFRDYVVVIEAPLSSDRSRAVLNKVKELAPGKPVRWVVATHHHFDHSGGLREYIAEGVTVVTHPKNAEFIRGLGKVPRTLRPDRLSAKAEEPRVESVSGKRTFSDGEQTVEIHPVQTTHAEDMVIAWLPRQKILFNSDLFGPPLVGPVGVANDFAVELLRAIRSAGWEVQTLAGGHGRPGTLAELEQAVSPRQSD